jgi:hypothetical protein
MPERIQLKRSKGWRKPEGAVVVSRPTIWGNPFRMAEYPADWSEDARRLEAVVDFRGMIEYGFGPLRPYPTPPNLIRELRGKDLACWCPIGAPCHADVLLELVNPVGGEDKQQ